MSRTSASRVKPPKLEIARILSRDMACYIPSRDVIAMPPLAAFESAEDYAATLNREAVHGTGAPHRVDRDLADRTAACGVARLLRVTISPCLIFSRFGLKCRNK